MSRKKTLAQLHVQVGAWHVVIALNLIRWLVRYLRAPVPWQYACVGPVNGPADAFTSVYHLSDGDRLVRFVRFLNVEAWKELPPSRWA